MIAGANTFARTCLKNPKDSAQIRGWLVSLEASAKKGGATANYSFFKLCSFCSELEAAKPTRELMMIDEPCAHVIPRLLSSVFVLFSSPHLRFLLPFAAEHNVEGSMEKEIRPWLLRETIPLQVGGSD